MSKTLTQQERPRFMLAVASPWPSCCHWDLELSDIEASHTIIRQVGETRGIYAMDALTDQGWLRTVNIEIEEEERERFLALFARFPDLQQSWQRV